MPRKSAFIGCEVSWSKSTLDKKPIPTKVEMGCGGDGGNYFHDSVRGSLCTTTHPLRVCFFSSSFTYKNTFLTFRLIKKPIPTNVEMGCGGDGGNYFHDSVQVSLCTTTHPLRVCFFHFSLTYKNKFLTFSLNEKTHSNKS